MRTPEEMADYPTHIKPGQIDNHVEVDQIERFIDQSTGYQITSDVGHKGVFASVESCYQPSLKEELIRPEVLVTSNVYQKIQSIPDKELKKYLEDYYQWLVDKMEKYDSKRNNKPTKSMANYPYTLYLKDLINMDRNLDLYHRLYELDRKINDKERRAYRDLTWFTRKGIKLDGDIGDKIFDMYVEKDKELMKDLESVSAELNIPLSDVPYVTQIIGDILLELPTATKEELKEKIKPPEVEDKSGKGISKAKAIAAAALIIGTGAAGAVAYNAYESGEKLKNDGFYFFHHPGDYEKYLKSVWEKHPNDIDNDGIPNDVEEKYGLNMFDPRDAKQDWDGDELTNYEELVKYAALFGPLNIHSKASDGDYYNDSYEVKVPGLDPNNPDVDHDGLLDGKDNDGDGFTNWFERNKMMTDPLVKNERYAVIVDALGDLDYYPYFNGTGMKNFLIKEFGYKPENVVLLDQKQASFTNFKKAINEIKEKITPNDILFVIMSAHGQPNIIHIYESAWYGDIAETLKDTKAERLIVDIGACYSGSAIKFFRNTSFESPLLLYTSTDDKTGSIIISDSMMKDMTEKKTDSNNDGFVSFHEAYVREYRIHSTWNKFYPQEYDPNHIAKHTYLGEYCVM